MKKLFLNKKLEFLVEHLESLQAFKDTNLLELKSNPRDLKYVEKLMQELVDCAVDINQFIAEENTQTRAWSAKQSFRDLKEHKLILDDALIKKLVETVSFRNEIIHSYDVGVYLLWSKRRIKEIIELYKQYAKKVETYSKKRSSKAS